MHLKDLIEVLLGGVGGFFTAAFPFMGPRMAKAFDAKVLKHKVVHYLALINEEHLDFVLMEKLEKEKLLAYCAFIYKEKTDFNGHLLTVLVKLGAKPQRGWILVSDKNAPHPKHVVKYTSDEFVRLFTHIVSGHQKKMASLIEQMTRAPDEISEH